MAGGFVILFVFMRLKPPAIQQKKRKEEIPVTTLSTLGALGPQQIIILSLVKGKAIKLIFVERVDGK